LRQKLAVRRCRTTPLLAGFFMKHVYGYAYQKYFLTAFAKTAKIIKPALKRHLITNVAAVRGWGRHLASKSTKSTATPWTPVRVRVQSGEKILS
jgi:hypothetical protein